MYPVTSEPSNVLYSVSRREVLSQLKPSYHRVLS